MKKNILTLSVILVTTLFVLQGCLSEKGEVPPPPETFCDSLDVSYNLHVKPLTEEKCATIGCHFPSGSGPDLTSYDDLYMVHGSIDERILLPVTDPQHMPPGGVLTQEEIDIFLCWLENEAPYN